VLHCRPQVPPWQAATPLGSFGQTVHPGPHAVASSSAAHAPAHAWNPIPQATPQVLPSQEACAAPFGNAQVMHDVPQEFTLVSGAQTWLQSCVPVGQPPTHACAVGMQTPKHSWSPFGHVPPHTPMTQVGVPPVGDGHWVHEPPQVAGALELTQTPLHR